MSNFPECLQPAVEQLEKYESKISVLQSQKQELSDNIQVLHNEKDELNKKIEDEAAAHKAAIENYEKEKLTLRELNIVVSNQLREKVDALNSLSASQSKLESQSIRMGAGQEALSHQTDRLNAQIEELRQQNSILLEENTALKSGHTNANGAQPSALEIAEIERLKQELNIYKNDNSDTAFLQSENARLIQRHGEITQEKMQASAKMHAAQKELLVANEKLDAVLKSLEQIEFEYQGLQNLHKNLTIERDALLSDNSSLVNAKAELMEKVKTLGEQIQRLANEKELIKEELNAEHIKADAMTEEVNHLRMKSRTLAEENKVLKEDSYNTPVNTNVQVQALEIQIPEDTDYDDDYEIEIAEPSTNSGPHFPGESHNDELK